MPKKVERKPKQAAVSGPAAVVAMPSPTSSPVSAAPAVSAHEPQRFTLADAFDYFEIPDGDQPSQSELNNERCVRAVAFLLHYLSDHGNESVDGFTAHGLGSVLEKCASDIAQVMAHREWLRENASSERQNP